MSIAKPTVVITDYTFPNLSIEEAVISAAGCRVLGRQCKSPEELLALCADANAVITQFARIDAGVIGAMQQARAIVRYGVGVDNIDLDAARARGIPVCNVPDYCMDEVADQTLAFILALTRQVLPHTLHLRDGRWGLATPITEFHALRDLAVGIVGLGRIGREVARRLVPFKCEVLAFDPVLPKAEIERLGCRPCGSLAELLPQCDLLTLHCPSTPTPRRLLNADTLSKMKPGAMLINVSRGDLIDPDALTASLLSGRLSAAALDVFDPEPIPTGHPILKMPNVILAPHVASVSPAAVRKLRETAAMLVVKAVRGELLPNIVNGVPGVR